ncbi:hypothetical protein ACUXZJ_14370 [Flavobacterium sp. TN-1]
MQKFGTCEFTVNDLVIFTFREKNTPKEDNYEVIKVLPNKDGTYEDRPFIENYWIRNTRTKEEYLVYHSELSLKQ